MTDFYIFTIAVLTVLITPGPTNTLLAASGATAGFWRSMPLLGAEFLGYLISILTIGSTLGRWVSNIRGSAVGLSVACGIYLLVLAAKLWRTGLAHRQLPVSFGQVFVATLLNPKAFVFALVIIPTHAPNALGYFATFFATVPIVGGAWIAFGSVAHRRTSGKVLILIPKLAAAALVLFSTMLIGSLFFKR